MWISEQTAIISLYNINWLVCITETECVYCAVRTGCLYKIWVNFVIINVNNWRLIVLRNDDWSRHMKVWGQSTGHNPLFIIIIIIIIMIMKRKKRGRGWQRRRQWTKIVFLLFCIGVTNGISFTEEQRHPLWWFHWLHVEYRPRNIVLFLC